MWGCMYPSLSKGGGCMYPSLREGKCMYQLIPDQACHHSLGHMLVQHPVNKLSTKRHTCAYAAGVSSHRD